MKDKHRPPTTAIRITYTIKYSKHLKVTGVKLKERQRQALTIRHSISSRMSTCRLHCLKTCMKPCLWKCSRTWRKTSTLAPLQDHINETIASPVSDIEMQVQTEIDDTSTPVSSTPSDTEREAFVQTTPLVFHPPSPDLFYPSLSSAVWRWSSSSFSQVSLQV